MFHRVRQQQTNQVSPRRFPPTNHPNLLPSISRRYHHMRRPVNHHWHHQTRHRMSLLINHPLYPHTFHLRSCQPCHHFMMCHQRYLQQSRLVCRNLQTKAGIRFCTEFIWTFHQNRTFHLVPHHPYRQMFHRVYQRKTNQVYPRRCHPIIHPVSRPIYPPTFPPCIYRWYHHMCRPLSHQRNNRFCQPYHLFMICHHRYLQQSRLMCLHFCLR